MSIPSDLKGLTNIAIPTNDLRVRPVVREQLIAVLKETKDFQQMRNRRKEIHEKVKQVFADHGREVTDATVQSTISSVITELRKEILDAQQVTPTQPKGRAK